MRSHGGAGGGGGGGGGCVEDYRESIDYNVDNNPIAMTRSDEHETEELKSMMHRFIPSNNELEKN